MSWFKVDDGFADHPKVVALQERREGKGALALWLLAGSWCSRHLTDGHVPMAAVRRLGGTPTEAAALVSVGLWVEVDNPSPGFLFHDWHACNPSAQTIKEKREAAKERVTRHREKRAEQRACNALQPRTSNAPVTPPPTRPDPTRPVPSPTETEHRHVDEPSAEAPPEPSRGKPRLTEDVSAVFEHWRAVFGKTAAAKLDPKRKRRIEWALATYGLDAVKRCIDGYAASPWHRGQNDRNRAYDDIELFLRDARHVEDGLSMADSPPRLNGRLAPARIDEESARQSRQAFEDFFGPIGEVANG